MNAFEKILNGLTYRHSIPAPSLVVVVSTRRAALDDNRASGGGKTEQWLLLRQLALEENPEASIRLREIIEWKTEEKKRS